MSYGYGYGYGYGYDSDEDEDDVLFARPENKFPHECPIGGCKDRFKTDAGLKEHLRTSRGRAHGKYRDSRGIEFLEKEEPSVFDRFGIARTESTEMTKKAEKAIAPAAVKLSKRKKRKDPEGRESRRRAYEATEKSRLEREKESERLEEIERKWRKANANPPPHADEGSKLLEAHGSFEVTSGGICFGLKHNCSYAASLAPASFSEAQPDHYNHKASNGIWSAYRFIQREQPGGPIVTIGAIYPMYSELPEIKEKADDPMECGWFICHSNCDPVSEVRRHLYAGFLRDCDDDDCDDDCDVNDDFLHISRYDIGRWDTRGLPNADKIDIFEEDGCELEEDGFHIIDWTDAKNGNWQKRIGGMINPSGAEGQKALVRFDGGEAQSFLYYDDEDFSQIYFMGGTAPIGRFPWTGED